MQLLLVTSRWPHAEVPEFLDDEIHHLARAFERVVVVPMRPVGPLVPAIPRSVIVDHSLAVHLERTRLLKRRSRAFTAATRLLMPNRAGFGFTGNELRHDGLDVDWIRASLLNRADSTSVARWAKPLSAPSLAYTFWLGAATVGLRRAWPDVPLISRVHGGDLFSEAHNWASIPFQAQAVRSVDRLASVSESGREYLADKFPEASEKIVVRRLGIRDVGARIRTPANGRLRILSASSIDANKRVDLIGRVAQHLERGGSTVEWTHLGDGPLRPELEAFLSQRPASLQVNLAGQVSLGEVHRTLVSGQHDVFVNLSLSEGAPVSLMEAQCVGLPVVASAVGGTPEVVPARLNELVDPRASVRDLSAAVIRAADRPVLEDEARRAYWAQHYEADVNYSGWAEELAGLATQPGRT